MNGRPGLCAVCRHARTIENRRGSTFWRCALSDVDARFPRYPRLPVLRCAGFESRQSPPDPDRSPDAPARGP